MSLFAKGTNIRVTSAPGTEKYSGHKFEAGQEVQIVQVCPDNSDHGAHYAAKALTPTGKPKGTWYLSREEFEPVVAQPETAPRPRRALPHQTQRDYARRAKSRLFSEKQNAVLQTASDGKEVDVFEFALAAQAALSLAATRAGQSTARREWAKEARALLHWANAILDNHLDGLPVYAEGDRSRKVEELKADVANLTEATASMRDELVLQTEALANEQARVVALIREKSQVEVALETTQSLYRDLDAEAARLRSRVDRGVFNYALALLSLDDQQRVYGYSDGIKGATSPTASI